jgi:hypothetical protein
MGAPTSALLAETYLQHMEHKQIQYNLGNLTHMGPRYRRITENDGLLEKVGTNLLQ